MTRRNLAAAVKQSLKRSRTGTATPIGWSFWGTYQRCKREWYRRYVDQIFPKVEPEYFTLGSAYHAFHEGKSEEAIREAFPAEIVDEAKRLHEARLNGPKIPDGDLVEELFEMPAGHPLHRIFTTRPDRVETDPDTGKKNVRDFKTTAYHRQFEADHWAVSGSMIGEMIGTGIGEATVDIVSKGKEPKTSQIQVGLTELKRASFVNFILDLAGDLRERLTRVQAEWANPAALSKEVIVERHFTRNTNECVNAAGQRCVYYDLCWGSPTAIRHYEHHKNDEWRSRLFDERDAVIAKSGGKVKSAPATKSKPKKKKKKK